MKEKLLRSLHKRRPPRRKRASVLNRAEIAAHFGVQPEAVEAYLSAKGIPYHADSNGEVWLSVPT